MVHGDLAEAAGNAGGRKPGLRPETRLGGGCPERSEGRSSKTRTRPLSFSAATRKPQPRPSPAAAAAVAAAAYGAASRGTPRPVSAPVRVHWWIH